MGGSSRGDHEMRLFLCLVVILACVALSTAGRKAKTRVVNCKKLAKKFGKCLKKGFAPKKPEPEPEPEPEVEGQTWCRHENSFLYSYAGASFDTLEEAQEACLANTKCNGITQEPYNNGRYTQRRGPDVHNWSPTGETSWTVCDEPEPESEPEPEPEPEVEGPTWCRHENSFLYSYAGASFSTLEEAQEACLANTKCNGITQ